MAFLTIFLFLMGISVAIALLISAIAVVGYLSALSVALIVRFIIPLGIIVILFLLGVLIYFLSHNNFATQNLLLLAGVFAGFILITYLINKANFPMTEKPMLFFHIIVLACLTASYHHFLEMDGIFAFVLAMFSSLPFVACVYKEQQD